MITLYTKPACPFCDRAKTWLENNYIPFESIDVTTDKDALRFIKEIEGHRSVPQIYFNDELFVEGGFDGLKKQNPVILKERMGIRL